MRIEPLDPKAVEGARRRKERCFQISLSHPIREKDRHPKTAFSASGPLPEKHYLELMDVVIGIFKRNNRKRTVKLNRKSNPVSS